MTLRTAHDALLLGDRDCDRAGRLARELSTRGFDPTLAFEAPRLLDLLDTGHFGLLTVASSLLDDGGLGSADFLRSVRERTSAPLLAIAENGSVAELLDRGVEAVVPGSATLEEVGAAASALRRLRLDPGWRERLTWGPLELDTARRQATWRGEPVAVTRLQFRLLATMVAADGAVVTREDLSRALYGLAPDDNGERVVAHVRRIREKLEEDSSQPSFLLTVRGEGFRLADVPRPVAAAS